MGAKDIYQMEMKGMWNSGEGGVNELPPVKVVKIP